MAIRLTFLTAVMRQDALEQHYPGGLAAFEARYAPSQRDTRLLALSAMSGAELQEILDDLAQQDVDVARFVAIGDLWGGPFQTVDGIAFANDASDDALPCWVAYAVD